MSEKGYVTKGKGKSLFGGTTCSNMDCPHIKKCRVNIYEDGLICPHYKSQQEWIYEQYERECERKGEEPMPRGTYFEF